MKKLLLLILHRHIIKCLREKGNNGNDFINHVLMALDLPRVGMPKFENPPPPPPAKDLTNWAGIERARKKTWGGDEI